jgi:hypothetical protein
VKKDWKYIAYIGSAIALFVVVKLVSPKQHDWTISFSHGDKNPYGGYALNELLPSVFSDRVRNSNQTVYELRDSLPGSNLLILASKFGAEKADTDALLEHAARGGSALISAHYFQGHFADTLRVATYDYVFLEGDIASQRDSSALRLINPYLDTTAMYFYRRDNIHNYFNRFDSTSTTVLAKNEMNQPVTVRVAWGDGYLVLNCTPLIFTNINLLEGKNHEFVSSMLSTLPQQKTTWTEYYQLGRREVSSPLRFVLSREPLRWAYYITIFSLLLFILFEAKRKQRIIPVIPPLANTTLDFVETIGTLYYQAQDHRNIALKKIHFLKDLIRSKYWLESHQLDDRFVTTLAAKSGKNKQDVQGLVDVMLTIQNSKTITPGALTDFNRKMENFTAGLL